MTPADLSALDALVRARGLAAVVDALADIASDRAQDATPLSPAFIAWATDAGTLRRIAAHEIVNRG